MIKTIYLRLDTLFVQICPLYLKDKKHSFEKSSSNSVYYLTKNLQMLRGLLAQWKKSFSSSTQKGPQLLSAQKFYGISKNSLLFSALFLQCQDTLKLFIILHRFSIGKAISNKSMAIHFRKKIKIVLSQIIFSKKPILTINKLFHFLKQVLDIHLNSNKISSSFYLINVIRNILLRNFYS